MSKEQKIKKAKERLLELALFSDDFDSFQRYFFENLKSDKKEEALELVLMVAFSMLKSDGELFNQLLLACDKAKSDGLKNWVRDSLKKVGG